MRIYIIETEAKPGSGLWVPIAGNGAFFFNLEDAKKAFAFKRQGNYRAYRITAWDRAGAVWPVVEDTGEEE